MTYIKKTPMLFLQSAQFPSRRMAQISLLFVNDLSAMRRQAGAQVKTYIRRRTEFGLAGHLNKDVYPRLFKNKNGGSHA